MFEKIVTPIGKFSYRFRKVILVAQCLQEQNERKE